MKSLINKLFEAKKEIGVISKDITNPFYKSRYFDINKLIEHVEPILNRYGLLLLQPILNGYVVSQIIEVETGDKIESSLELSKGMNAQNSGSEITYFRRYTLASLLSLQAEDDDANKTVEQPEKKETKQPETWLNIYEDKAKTKITEDFIKCHQAIHDGTGKYTIASIRKRFKVSKEAEAALNNKSFLN